LPSPPTPPTPGSEMLKLAGSRGDVSINTFTGDANQLDSGEEETEKREAGSSSALIWY